MNVRIAQLVGFNAGNWFDNSLEMTQYTVKLWMVTQALSTDEQNIAFRRMRHFMQEQIENTIFIDESETVKCAELAQAGLNITTLPGEPSEQLIGIMLYHKLNAIMEGRISLLEIEISAGDGVIYLHGHNETSQDLVAPDWWSTADLSHNNVVAADSDNIVSIPQGTVWRELDLSWPDSADADSTGNIVVFADFKNANETE
jgi:alpha-L-arabinofuranosidase